MSWETMLLEGLTEDPLKHVILADYWDYYPGVLSLTH